jgi:hypothetical protein
MFLCIFITYKSLDPLILASRIEIRKITLMKNYLEEAIESSLEPKSISAK